MKTEKSKSFWFIEQIQIHNKSKMALRLERGSIPSFWISPDINIFDTPVNKTLKKPKHQRCNSGKLSPYQDQSSLMKLKSALQTITRKQSPNSSAKLKNSPYKPFTKSSKPSLPLPKPGKKKVLKLTKKKKSKVSIEKLKVLNKKTCKIAPKIFENQIFCDIYDEQGNHDRVMETFDVSESRTRIEEDSFICNNAKLILAENIKIESDETDHKSYVRQPENSFLADTERGIKGNHLELFKKLEGLAKERSFSD